MKHGTKKTLGVAALGAAFVAAGAGAASAADQPGLHSHADGLRASAPMHGTDASPLGGAGMADSLSYGGNTLEDGLTSAFGQLAPGGAPVDGVLADDSMSPQGALGNAPQNGPQGGPHVDAQGAPQTGGGQLAGLPLLGGLPLGGGLLGG